MEMINSVGLGGLCARRSLIGATALGLVLGFSGTVSATTLQNMFNGSTFTQDGLEFSNFTRVLANTLPTGQELEALVLSGNVAALSSIPFLDFTAGKFSHAWGNATAANAGNIDLVVLADNGATPGVDPGFRLNSGNEWAVTAGTIASGQLSAFAYDVTKTLTSKQINSADISQFSTIDGVGPDIFPFAGWPDIAGGFALQFIMDPNSNDILNALLNVTFDLGVQSPFGMMQFSQFNDWSGFTDRDAIRVVNVVGVLASSGGGFTMNALEQRIDPPPPANGQVPEPGTLLLISIGLMGMAYRWWRPTSDTQPVSL